MVQNMLIFTQNVSHNQISSKLVTKGKSLFLHIAWFLGGVILKNIGSNTKTVAPDGSVVYVLFINYTHCKFVSF